MALEYTETGSGPKIVLLHPVGLSSEFWPLLPNKLKSDYTVVTVDLAGHGVSPNAEQPGEMAHRVHEVVELLQEIGEPVLLLGVSFGGMIAMQIAINHPELLRGLVLAACPAQIPIAGRPAILERAKVAEEGGMRAVVDGTLARWFSPAFLPSDMVRRIRDRLLRNKPSNWAAAWEAVVEHDVIDRLGEINVPTLVIAGEADAATPLAAKKALSAAIPGSRLAVILGAPHMVHIERPEEFAKFVSDFLLDLEG